MSNFYYGAQQQAAHSSLHTTHSHHPGRQRRSTRAIGYHQRNEQKQMRALQLKKEAAIETALEQNIRREFEAARSFDIEDDEMFCPFYLLTEDDVSSLPFPRSLLAVHVTVFRTAPHPIPFHRSAFNVSVRRSKCLFQT